MAARLDPSALLAAALVYAARGWHVFPTRPGRKIPALHGVRDCPRTGPCTVGHAGWEQRATIDPDRIRRCWSAAPFGIAIATGPSGLVVVDLDLPKAADERPPIGWSRRGCRDGRDVFAAVCADHNQPVPATRTLTTPRGGQHLYFTNPAVPGLPELRNTEGEHGNGLGWKVDTRAHGGYVLAPPSTTPDGTYALAVDLDPVELPDWLANRLAPTPVEPSTTTATVSTDRLPAYVDAAVAGEVDRVVAAQPTNHSRVLFVAAVALGQLVGGHLLPAATAELELLHAARHMISGPCRCTEREIRRTIANGLRAGAARPRTAPPPSVPQQPAAPSENGEGLWPARGAA